MPYLNLDDNFNENPKIEALSDRTFRLHVRALGYCARNLTDGHITAKAAKVLLVQTSATKRNLDELIHAGLWVPAVGGGYEAHDYLEYNRTADEVKEDRRKARERMKRLRAKGSPERSGEHTGERSGTQAFPRVKDQKPFADATDSTPAKGRFRVTNRDVPPTVDFAARAALAQARVTGDAA